MWPFRSKPAVVAPTAPAIVALLDDTVDPRLVVYHDPAGQQAEQYRGFRTNLRAINPRDEPRALLITSAQPREGKSVTVANIACAIAESEALHVCLVDADVRDGSLHRLKSISPEPGFGFVTFVPLNQGLLLIRQRLTQATVHDEDDFGFPFEIWKIPSISSAIAPALLSASGPASALEAALVLSRFGAIASRSLLA